MVSEAIARNYALESFNGDMTQFRWAKDNVLYHRLEFEEHYSEWSAAEWSAAEPLVAAYDSIRIPPFSASGADAIQPEQQPAAQDSIQPEQQPVAQDSIQPDDAAWQDACLAKGLPHQPDDAANHGALYNRRLLADFSWADPA